MRRVLMGWVVALLLGGGLSVLVIGCSDSGGKVEVVALDQVPEPLVKKAKETLPEVRFESARKLPNGNYEIRGKSKAGKVREVEVNPSGEVVEIE